MRVLCLRSVESDMGRQPNTELETASNFRHLTQCDMLVDSRVDMVAQPTLVPTPSEEKLPPGGGWLLEPATSREIFTSERFSDDQRQFYKAAVEFVESEVVPKHKDIEKKKPGLARE